MTNDRSRGCWLRAIKMICGRHIMVRWIGEKFFSVFFTFYYLFFITKHRMTYFKAKNIRFFLTGNFARSRRWHDRKWRCQKIEKITKYIEQLSKFVFYDWGDEKRWHISLMSNDWFGQTWSKFVTFCFFFNSKNCGRKSLPEKGFKTRLT